MQQSAARGWVAVDYSFDEISDTIRRGHAFAPIYKGGHRKGQNFISANFIAADCDEGMTVTQARDKALVNAHASFIYTTPSHTEEAHRFRIVFLLEHPITDGQEWANACFGLAHTLGTDPSIGDAARFGHTLPAEKINELIEYGESLRSARMEGIPVDTTMKVATNMVVRLATGESAFVEDLSPSTSIHCPYHDDRRPSAFIVQSQTLGGKGIHCRTCGVTRWPAHADEYDFDAFDKMIEQGDVEGAQAQASSTGLSKFFPPEPTIKRFRKQFLPDISYAPGITIVKSPKGSGKTKMLAQLIKEIANGQYSSDVNRRDRIKSVLLIGHRRALIREAARKLGLEFYMVKGRAELADEPAPSDADTKEASPSYPNLNTLAVCLDSLPRWNEPYVARRDGPRLIFDRNEPYDLVIIDESEQVLRHMLGKTIENKTGGVKRVYDALKYEVENAKAVIALDADLSMLTTHALRHLRPQDWQARTRIFYNEPTAPAVRRQLLRYTRETALREELISAINNGLRCFVTTNSKKSAKVLAKTIVKRCGNDIKLKVVTSDNSTDPNEIEFVKNIQKEILTIQVLICSPSLGTGIDITFPDGACKVDCVFGFFYAKVNTHTDIDQQLARVRNPGSVKVWVSPARFRYSSNFDVIRDDLARAYRVPSAVTGRSTDGLVEYNPHDSLLLVCTHITASERASKNRLVDLFCKLREANGWDICKVDEPAVKNTDRSDAEKALWNENAEALLGADKLDKDEFFDLSVRRDGRAPLSPAERAQYERALIEHTLDVVLTYDIIKLNYDGRLIERVGVLSKLLMYGKSVQHLIEHVLAGQREPLDRITYLPRPVLIACIGTLIGLTDDLMLLRHLEASTETLAPFVELCTRNSTTLECIIGMPLRRDLATNPVKQLNVFLRMIGLKLEPMKRVKKSGKTTRTYTIDDKKFDLMFELARRFKAPEDLQKEARQWDWDRSRIKSLEAMSMAA
ncbi:MAG: hypothetical protein NTZ72_19235 [Afipia sp.]|nr:hypothetical protein [Afipia sp.]